MGQLYLYREKLFLKLMSSFNKHFLNISGSAEETRMKTHSAVLKELTVLVVNERLGNNPISKVTAIVEICAKYSESVEKVHQNFPGRAGEGCIEEVFFKLKLGG